MTISEVQSLAEQELQPVTSTAFRGVYGTHTIDKGNISVWLHFEDQHLRAVSRWRPEAGRLKAVYISPKKDLCTGDLSFFLRLFRPAALEDPAVYLDGREVEDFPWARPYELSLGEHEIRVEEEGYKPIIKHLHFDKEDPGELWLDITGDDLHPEAPTEAGRSSSS